MKNTTLPFSTTLIGSMPRSKELIELKMLYEKDATLLKKFDSLVFEETKNVINLLEEADIDIVVSGELSRDNYMSYIAENVDGIQLMTMEEIKNAMANVEAFNKSLDKMGAADNSMRSPICIAKINTDTALNIKEIENIKLLTNKPFKITLPSPYLLTRSMWLKEITGQVYDHRKDLGSDVVELLINEIRRLVKLGAKIIQIDEPILSEVVFTTENEDSSFY